MSFIAGRLIDRLRSGARIRVAPRHFSLAPLAGALALVLGAPGSLASQEPAAEKAEQARPAAAEAEAAGAPAEAARAGPATLERIATVEGITEYRLSNGLRVLLFPDPSKQTTTVNITYMVGSRHEGYGESGMAHLLEHLVFKGTPDHPDIPQELTERGARPNGSTWFDRTNYFETFPAAEDNLAWALDLESDRMVNSFIAQEDLDSEMTVVRNEFEAGENSPFGVLLKRTLSTAFQWHNYGNSTIGARSDIENVPIGRLKAFYRKYYQPDNALLVVAGRFDEGRALELIEEKFGALPRPDRTGAMKLYSTYTAEPTQDGARTVTLRRVGDVQLVMAVYHVPPGSHEDFAAIDVLTHVLGSEPSGRLYQALVETGKAADVNAFAFQLHDPGVLILMAEVRQEDSLEEARRTLLATVDALDSEPPTEEEVERARNARLSDMELAFNDSERIALQLSEWASAGDWRLRFIHRDRLREVTPADVAQVAARYLRPSNRTVGLYMPVEETPLRAEIPEAPDIAALVGDYGGGEAVAEGEAFDPSPANIESRTSRFALDNGFEFALLPKETRGNAVVASLRLRLGSEEALTGRASAGDLAGDMLMRGTTVHTRQELQDEFDRLRAQVQIAGGPTSAFARIETTRENLVEVLELVGEVLRQPAFSESEWTLLKEERLASLEAQQTQPTALGSRAFGRHMDPWPVDHPLYNPTIEESIARVRAATLEEARRFYEDFYGAGAGTMAVVGDFDADSVQRTIEEIFGSFDSARPFERIEQPYRAVAQEQITIETPDKANAFFLAGLNLPVGDEHEDYPALVLGNYMLGGGFLNSRLATRIRQEEGISYGVGSQLQASSLDERGIFVTYAIYAPQNAEELERAFGEEIQEVLAEGYAAEEVQAAKEGYLDSRDLRRAQDDALASMLAESLYLDRTLEFEAAEERRIAELTPEEILEAMRRHIDPESITIVKAGDFAGVAQAEVAGGPEAAADGSEQPAADGSEQPEAGGPE